MLERTRRIGAVVRRAVQAFFEDEALTQGAAVAFFTGLSLGPILVLMMWASSALGPETQARLVDQVARLIGQEGSQVVDIVIENADTDVSTANLAGWLSLGALVLSATAAFGQLQVALNAVWGVSAQPAGLGILAWLRKRLWSLGLVVSVGFLLLVSLALSSGLAALSHTIADTWPGAWLVWVVADLLVPFLLYVGIFMAMYRYLPDVDLQWRHVWFGSITTATLFVVGKSLIGLYLGTRALGSAYGAAGSLLVMLVWTYYSAAIVLFGAELTQAYAAERGERIELTMPGSRGGQVTPRATQPAPSR